MNKGFFELVNGKVVFIESEEGGFTRVEPEVIKRYYDENGNIKGMCILVRQGIVPVDGQLIAQWLQGKSNQ